MTFPFRFRWFLCLVGTAFVLLSPTSFAQDRFITLASTTSTEQSGLFAHLLQIGRAHV